MMNGRMNVDSDGFLVSDEQTVPSVAAPPPIVAIPRFFEGCPTREHAIAKMIDELSKPFSIEMEGHDEMYRRLSNALILVLAIQGDLTP